MKEMFKHRLLLYIGLGNKVLNIFAIESQHFILKREE